LDIETLKEYKESPAPEGCGSAHKKRDPLSQIENHPLLNSKSKCRSRMEVRKEFCDFGDSEL
jgi:hypothetical protein